MKLRKELLPDSSLKVKSGNIADTGKMDYQRLIQSNQLKTLAK